MAECPYSVDTILPSEVSVGNIVQLNFTVNILASNESRRLGLTMRSIIVLDNGFTMASPCSARNVIYLMTHRQLL